MGLLSDSDDSIVAGHFQRVILMSGSIFSVWSRVTNPSEMAVRLARRMGCYIPTDLHKLHNKILNCLRHQTVENITSVRWGIIIIIIMTSSLL